jgi:hypothetical protein
MPQGYVHFEDISGVIFEKANDDQIAKVEEGWTELKELGRDARVYQVYEEGRLVTPTMWTIGGAWNKILSATNPKWHVKDYVWIQGEKPMISQEDEAYDDYTPIWDSIGLKNPTSVKMYAKDHTTGVSMMKPFCMERLWVVVKGEVRSNMQHIMIVTRNMYTCRMRG